MVKECSGSERENKIPLILSGEGFLFVFLLCVCVYGGGGGGESVGSWVFYSFFVCFL